jgi:hypothetical protein
VWQLHDKLLQLRHLFQCVEYRLKTINGVGISVTFDLFCSTAEVNFRELLDLTQFFDAVVTEAAML